MTQSVTAASPSAGPPLPPWTAECLFWQNNCVAHSAATKAYKIRTERSGNVPNILLSSRHNLFELSNRTGIVLVVGSGRCGVFTGMSTSYTLSSISAGTRRTHQGGRKYGTYRLNFTYHAEADIVFLSLVCRSGRAAIQPWSFLRSFNIGTASAGHPSLPKVECDVQSITAVINEAKNLPRARISEAAYCGTSLDAATQLSPAAQMSGARLTSSPSPSSSAHLRGVPFSLHHADIFSPRASMKWLHHKWRRSRVLSHV